MIRKVSELSNPTNSLIISILLYTYNHAYKWYIVNIMTAFAITISHAKCILTSMFHPLNIMIQYLFLC